MIKRIILFFVFFSLLLFLLPKNSFAASNFSSSYNVTYSVLNNADTNVHISVTLTNLTQNYYASSYSVQLGFTDIRNLTASDNDGKVTAVITKSDKGSTIDVPFNSLVVGLDKKLNFDIYFNTSEIAEDLSNVWDVNIPGISNENDFSDFNVNVIYPSFLGKPTFIKPNIPGVIQNASGNTISFSKNDLGKSGISLAFGAFQVYDFNLNYHLENTNVFKVQTEIALPPNTNYQDVYLNSLFPKPTNVYIDKDGNWMAKYILEPSKKITVNLKGQAKIYLNPKPETLSSEQMKNYLEPKSYWESDNSKIIKLARELKTPQNIYNYVADTLHYDFSRIESNSPRLGAVQALNNPNSVVCLEFTDLFIAIARAAGIPAREINGYAYTNNNSQRPLSLIKDILHSWPEYYDFEKSSWIMVDPTWGNTTNGVDYFSLLDFDHFAFTISGINSSYPVPAGGYKFSNNLNSKDIEVTIAPKILPSSINAKPSLAINNDLTAGLPISGSIRITNTGNTLIEKDFVQINTSKIVPYSQELAVSPIPPFGFVDIPFDLDKTNFLTNETDTVKITFKQNSTYEIINISPFFLSKWMLIGGVLILVTTIFISIIIIGYRRIPLLRQKWGNTLRW